jgi:hypothetical protein
MYVSASDPGSPGVRLGWRELLETSDDPFALYQSPEFFDHVRERPGVLAKPSLAVRRDPHRALVAVVPLFHRMERCRFRLALGHTYLARAIEMITIRSGRLLIRSGSESLDGLFSALRKRFPGRAVKIENIPLDGPLYRYLHSCKNINECYFLYEEPYKERVHLIPLTSSYEQFTQKYSAKKRYNLRRQFRILEERSGGRLACRVYTSSEDVPDLRDSYETLIRVRDGLPDNAPWKRRTEFDALRTSEAKHGFLRSYVLKDGDRPIGCMLGFLYAKTFLLIRTLHDPAYAAFSPGTALLHMVIQELIEEKGVTLINTGYGNPEHEFRSTSSVLDYTSIWLLPNTWKNRLFSACYQTFRRVVRAIEISTRPPAPANHRHATSTI